ncbi:MAG: helix-turn-helix domain-containing protein [bacterium]
MSANAKLAQKIGKSIPALLKAKRKEKKMTLQELAQKAELSPAFVSQAERGKAAPSIISLIQLAGALDTDINYFLTPPKSNDLVRRADNPVVVDIDSPIVYHSLDGDVPNKQLNALYFEIPDGSDGTDVHRSEGEDFFYVLEGNVTIRIGGEHYFLAPGDCAHINSQLDHSVKNESGSVAKVLWVGTPTIFP